MKYTVLGRKICESRLCFKICYVIKFALCMLKVRQELSFVASHVLLPKKSYFASSLTCKTYQCMKYDILCLMPYELFISLLSLLELILTINRDHFANILLVLICKCTPQNTVIYHIQLMICLV